MTVFIAGIQHIKAAYDLGINTFDTANMYSNGESEVVLGKAIKQHNLPRDEIVVMTKVRWPVGRTLDEPIALGLKPKDELEGELRYTNQYGLSRKVRDHGVEEVILAEACVCSTFSTP